MWGHCYRRAGAKKRRARNHDLGLLLRSGWLGWYEQTDAATRERLAKQSPEEFASPGLANEERSAAWLWDHQVAAVAADCPSVEVMPVVMVPEEFLHFRLIALLGMAMGELFKLDPLAADCAPMAYTRDSSPRPRSTSWDFARLPSNSAPPRFGASWAR